MFGIKKEIHDCYNEIQEDLGIVSNDLHRELRDIKTKINWLESMMQSIFQEIKEMNCSEHIILVKKRDKYDEEIKENLNLVKKVEEGDEE